MDCGKKTLFRCLNNKFIDIQYTPLGPLRHPPLMPLKSSSHPLQYPPLGLILFNILLSCLFNILLSSSSISSSHPLQYPPLMPLQYPPLILFNILLSSLQYPTLILVNILLSSSSISSSHTLQYPPLILFNILLTFNILLPLLMFLSAIYILSHRCILPFIQYFLSFYVYECKNTETLCTLYMHLRFTPVWRYFWVNVK